jgi:hypothetical protein
MILKIEIQLRLLLFILQIKSKLIKKNENDDSYSVMHKTVYY